MSQFIWSLGQLQELIANPEPSVQRWAVNKWFQLYPESAKQQFERLLTDSRESVIDEALNHLGKRSREELLPLLKSIFLDGAPAASAKAIRLLGEWGVAEAVDWMRQRILREQPLQEEQIASMIYALGQIPGADSRDLLKQTEQSVREQDFKYWNLFYASLLNHQDLEDVDSVLQIFVDVAREEQRRREALGILLATVDPSLNPADVYFGNKAVVAKHQLQRVEGFAEALGQDLASKISESLGSVLNPPAARSSSATLDALERCFVDLNAVDLASFEWGMTQRALQALQRAGNADESSYGLLCLALSAFLAALEAKAVALPHTQGEWQIKLNFLLRNRPPRPGDETLMGEVVQGAERAALVEELLGALDEQPGSWGALRAVEMLGELKAVEALPQLAKTMAGRHEEFFQETVRMALLRLGDAVVPVMIPWLESSSPLEQASALALLGALPTPEAVDALVRNFPGLYASDPDRALGVVFDPGAEAFIPVLEAEYRQGELELGRVFLHLCRVNNVRTAHFLELEREAKMADAVAMEHRRLFQGTATNIGWPRSIPLELACKHCGKRYHYDVSDLHLHPTGEQGGAAPDDFTPYRHGMVIRDDLRCKNCRTVNQLQLTPKSVSQISAESIKVLAFTKTGLKIPEYYPVKHIQWHTKEDKVVTLQDSEREHLEAVDNYPTKPAAHLALGKFYEYVKQDQDARRAYLRALDLDTHCVESMAGLARLEHAAGQLKAANEWIESCYASLEKGHYYLAEDQAAFKKAVRDARRDYAREFGARPKEAPVEIRFHVDVAEHPKNKPCPCGSGKKYKLCCMPGKKDG